MERPGGIEDMSPVRLSDQGVSRCLTKGVGWLGIALGLAEVIAPGPALMTAGIPDKKTMRILVRACGVREIASGIGILSGRAPAGWLWGRVAGDAVNMAILDSAMLSKNTNRRRALAASSAIMAVTVLDVYCLRNAGTDGGYIDVRETGIIDRPPSEVYGFWRNLENFPRIMEHLESVRTNEDGFSHWQAKGPAGKRAEWMAQIVADEPDSLIEWCFLPGYDIEGGGAVRFDRAIGGRGTLVTVDICYRLPGGRIASDLARLFTMEPGQEMESALRRAKQILETGTVTRSG